jgi:NAD(P)-dependent dehydrogenase (short-subunit alcohol dehydrogenase family)
VHYRTNRAGAEGVGHLIEEAGGTAVLSQGDLNDPATAERAVAKSVERTGRLDVLVNNAAVQPVMTLTEMTVAQWQDVVDTNLRAAFACSKAAADRMIDQPGGGSIIHIASIEGSQPAFGHAHYASSKAALIMHARSAALELGPHGIRVNTVSPGLVDRAGLRDDWPAGVDRYTAAAPLGRLIAVADVAAACLFLASPLAAAITGHDLVVDAGVSCHPTW